MARPPYIVGRGGRGALGRRPGGRAAEQSVLIVCEGETEIEYFNALRVRYHLNKGAVDIPRSAVGRDPQGLVKFAVAQHKNYGPYDHIFCVFDRDTHAHFDNARETIRQLAGRARLPLPIFEAITIPAFEVWAVMHFERTTKPFMNADEVIGYLRARHMPAYDKADGEIAGQLVTRVDDAIENARWLEQQIAASGADCPFTNIHLLATMLRGMAG